MALPPDFRFSQNNLQDYVDCARRFELKHILRQPWPAIQSEPVLEAERHQEMGLRFHLLVQQHLNGIPEEKLARAINDPDLQMWWQNYLKFSINIQDQDKEVEYSLTIPFYGFALTAKYDVLIFDEGKRASIIDWKTNSHRLPSNFLQHRIQTIIYPLILVETKQVLRTNLLLLPENIQMLYWFPNFPDEPEIIPYSSDLHQQNREYINTLVQEINGLTLNNFPMTSDEKICRYCVYRSLCQRGINAGLWADGFDSGFNTKDDLADFNFNEVEEIEF